MDEARRFPIRRYWWLRPLLFLFGGTRRGSFVEIGRRALRVRFGPLFDESFDIVEIEVVRYGRWPFVFGLGWRTDLAGRIALVGSYSGIVEIKLRARQRRRFLLPFLHLKYDRLVVSLDDPEAFLDAARSLLTTEPFVS
jgi:hypothetical protein